MGSYLSTPVTEKESENGLGKEGLDYGASAMQGWRVSQEDAHVTLTEFDDRAMLFAVFDGHGGAEVAKYAATNLGAHLKSLDKYKQGDYEGALGEAFLSFDAILREPHVLEVLKAIAKSADSEQGDDHVAVDGGSSDDDDEDLEGLLEDADETLEEIIQRCDADQVKAIIQKRIDMGRILSAAAAKISGEDDSEDEDSDEDEESDDEEEEEEGEDGVPSSADEAGPAITNGQDVKTLKQVKLEHLVHAADSEEGQVQDSHSASEPNGTAINELSKDKGITSSVDCKKDSSDEKVSVEATPATSVSSPSVIIDDDVASSAPGPSCGEASGSRSDPSVLPSNGVDDVDADTDYKPSDEIDSDDDDENEWETEEEAAPEHSGRSGRRLLMAPKMFDFSEMGHSLVPGFDSGATACLAFVKDDILYVANVGDSRCVVSQNGIAVEMSHDHKPEDAIETARINKAGGKVTSDGRVNNGLNLSRALGDHNYKRNEELDLSEQMISAKPDILKLQLDSSHEFMVIACDGIWNSMSSQEVVTFVRERSAKTPAGNLSRICEELFDAVLAPTAGGDGTGMDNTTCIIVRFPRPVFAEEVVEQVNGTQKMEISASQDAALVLNGSQKRSRDQGEAEGKADELMLGSAKKIKTADPLLT